MAASPVVSAAWDSLSDNLPSLEKETEYIAANSTLIYDSSPNPQTIAVLNSGETRILLTPEQVPEKMKHAVVVIEDERFYEHSGVDPVGLGRALLANFISGEVVEGGSTITQQYIKNSYVSSETSVERKFREAIFAYELEQRWSKDMILSEYLNTIYFGNGAYGLQVAAQVYFNKGAPALTLSECALLAALPKSPIQYDPFTNPEAARSRRDLVLDRMLSHGMISREEHDEAASTPLPTAPFSVGPETSPAPYFVEYVKEQLINRYGTRTTFDGGLHVYTSLDLQKQAAADAAVASVLNQPGDPSAALVSLEPATGYVRAMVGGLNFETQKFNAATQGHRQPGSAFKPFVLATALGKGISPGTTFVSEPKQISLGAGGAVWSVVNYDSVYLGKVSLEKATVYSDNAVYADLMMKVGPEAVADTAHKAGINTSFSAQPAIALGGLDNGVSPLELASAYGTFANGGQRVSGSIDFDGNGADPISIIKVMDSRGTVIDDNQPSKTMALDPVVAYYVNEVLKKVAMTGTNRWSNLGRPVAGKSGTTEDHVDAWFSGYTPDLVTTVWVGYTDQRTPMQDIRGVRVTGGSWPSQIWRLYMDSALADVPARDFYKPPNANLVPLDICVTSGLAANPWCPKKERRSFLPNVPLPGKCNEHLPHEVTMPAVASMRFGEAWKTIESLGLEVELVFRNDSSRPADLIVEQQPAAGTRMMQGKDKVKIVVAGPPGSVQIPEPLGE